MDARPVDQLTEAEAVEELTRLADEIAAHDIRYYQQDQPSVSDAEYDALKQRNAALELRFPPTPFRVRVAASAEALSIRHAAEEPADAVIEGTPLAFLRLLTNASTTTIRAGGLDVRGDAEVAEGFRSLFEAARPDLEEELSRFTGDAAAHHAARLAREAADFGRRAGDALARNLSEFLSEESRDVPAILWPSVAASSVSCTPRSVPT